MQSRISKYYFPYIRSLFESVAVKILHPQDKRPDRKFKGEQSPAQEAISETKGGLMYFKEPAPLLVSRNRNSCNMCGLDRASGICNWEHVAEILFWNEIIFEHWIFTHCGGFNSSFLPKISGSITELSDKAPIIVTGGSFMDSIHAISLIE